MGDQLIRAIVRECIRRDDRSQERLLRECVRHLFEQYAPAQDLRTVIEQTLSDKSGELGFTAEQAPGTKSEVYARFISSDVRDTNMDALARAIETDVLKAFPDAIVEKVNLSKHSRQVLRVQLGSDVVTVAFKGASAGGEGLEFEDALFAIIKTLPTITDMTLTGPEKKRLINSFGLGPELGNKEMMAALREVLEDTASLKPSIVSLLQRAEVSVAAIQRDPTFTALGDLSGVTLSGGAGGKADIVLKFGDQEIDISLKHEKEKEGTNVFVFNKDLGDGTKEVTLGRNDPPALEQFKANLIPSPEPWWQVVRKRIVDALKRTPGYNLTNDQEAAFVTQTNPESLMAVKQLFIADKKAGGEASKMPSEVLREVGTALQEQLASLDPAQVLSIIEESQFGATSTNPLYKLTSSGAGTRLKPVDPSEAAKQNVQGGADDMRVKVAKTRVAVPKAQRGPDWEPTDTTESKSSFSVEIIDRDDNVLGSLIIMGVKFRTSIFATTKGGLSIKTRA